MAAGTFTLYTTGAKHVAEDNISLKSDTFVAVPLHSGYTPATASHSALAQITSYQATASGSVVASITLSGITVTASGGVAIKWDADDIAGFSAGGDTFQTKYVAVYAQSASDGNGNDNLLLGFFDTDTAAGTGVEGTQINVNWSTYGLFKYNVNGG